MEIYVKDWYECPFRREVNPEKKFIKSHRYYHEGHSTEYPSGLCVILSLEKETDVSCPEKSRTHVAGQIVGDAPRQCPLRKESITLKTGHRFGETTFHY